jgi:hypothetical protein
VDTPDIKGREQIFRVHLGKLKLEKSVEHYSGVCGWVCWGVGGLTGIRGDLRRQYSAVTD